MQEIADAETTDEEEVIIKKPKKRIVYEDEPRIKQRSKIQFM